MSGSGLLPTQEAIARANALSQQPKLPHQNTGLIPSKNVRNAYTLNLKKVPRKNAITSNFENPLTRMLMGLPTISRPAPLTLGGKRRHRSMRKSHKSRRRTHRK